MSGWGWFILIVSFFALGFQISLVIMKLDELLHALRQIHDEAIGSRLALEETLSVVHCIESDTHRVQHRWRTPTSSPAGSCERSTA